MKILFVISVGVILYVYVGYPLFLKVLSIWYSRPTLSDNNYLPKISLIISAYNEQQAIPEKLKNSLALDYPKNLIDIIVVSDGSTDGTNDIVNSYKAQGITLFRIDTRGGKARALNCVIPQTQGDILILSDANAMYREDAIRKLVRHFVDPTVGAVSGNVQIVDAATSYAYSEQLYYRLERFEQKMESQIGAVVGADGAMYAVRREAFHPPSDSTIVDDFVISMEIARRGYRVLYDEDAIATETGTSTGWEEFQRKIRIVAGGIQALKIGEGLPRFNQPLLLFCYVSHKLLRWLVPLWLLLIFLISVLLIHESFFQMILIVQLLIAGAGISYSMGILNKGIFKWNCIPYYFYLVNGAALIGLYKGLLGKQTVLWRRTGR